MGATLKKITSSGGSRLSCLALHLNLIVVFTYFQMNRAKGETPPCLKYNKFSGLVTHHSTRLCVIEDLLCNIPF